MRSATGLFVLVGCVAFCSAVEAKGHPAPGDCPTDVAAAVGEMCPCAGKTLPNDSVQPWKNHGQYVSCVVRFRNALRKAGCFADDSVRRTLARCAARSTCGKADAVVCCFSDAGACNDASPGDGTATGTCSNNPTMACDGDARSRRGELYGSRWDERRFGERLRCVHDDHDQYEHHDDNHAAIAVGGSPRTVGRTVVSAARPPSPDARSAHPPAGAAPRCSCVRRDGGRCPGVRSR